jgi:hypothetical protein
LTELLASSAAPCISIYQPTHRHHPDNHQDPIRFGNLVAEVETALGQKYSNRAVRPLLEPLRTLEADRVVPGTSDATSGRVTFDELAHPRVDDLLDDLAELIPKKGGEVVVVPAERMPTPSGVAAIYRF